MFAPLPSSTQGPLTTSAQQLRTPGTPAFGCCWPLSTGCVSKRMPQCTSQVEPTLLVLGQNFRTRCWTLSHAAAAAALQLLVVRYLWSAFVRLHLNHIESLAKGTLTYAPISLWRYLTTTPTPYVVVWVDMRLLSIDNAMGSLIMASPRDTPIMELSISTLNFSLLDINVDISYFSEKYFSFTHILFLTQKSMKKVKK